jgi:WD40 repeat protein
VTFAGGQPAFSRDGRRVVTAYRQEVKVWDAATGREVLSLPLNPDAGQLRPAVGALAFSPDGHRLYAALHDGTVRYWDATPVAGREGESP